MGKNLCRRPEYPLRLLTTTTDYNGVCQLNVPLRWKKNGGNPILTLLIAVSEAF